MARRAISRTRRCPLTERGFVDDVELDASRLALIDTYITRISRTTEVRMQSVTGGPQRLVALMHAGEGVQTWIGPSWDDVPCAVELRR